MPQLTTRRKPMCVTRSFFALLFVATFVSAPAAAQTTWVESTGGGPQVTLEWVKPSFDEGDAGLLGTDAGTTFLTSRLLLSGQYPLSDRARLEADLPLAHYGSQEGNVSSTKLGNPYLGARYQFGWAGAVGGGIRLPLADVGGNEETLDDFAETLSETLALSTGSYSDPRRTEAYLPDAFTARGYLERTFALGSGFAVRFRPGLSLLVPTEGEDNDVQAILDYGGQVWYGGSLLRAGLGLGGRTNMSADSDRLDDRSVYFLNTAIQRQFGNIRLGFVARVPLSEEVSSAVPYAAGVTLTIAL